MPSVEFLYDALGRLVEVDYECHKTIFDYDSLGNRTLEVDTGPCDCVSFTIRPKSSSFTANEGPGYYRITSDSDVTATMPTDAPIGSVYKFKMIGAGICTLDFGTLNFNHANSTASSTISIKKNSGVVEMIAVESGFDET